MRIPLWADRTLHCRRHPAAFSSLFGRRSLRFESCRDWNAAKKILNKKKGILVMRIPLWADRIRCTARRLPCQLPLHRLHSLTGPSMAPFRFARSFRFESCRDWNAAKKILNKKKEFPFWKFLSGPTGFEPVE